MSILKSQTFDVTTTQKRRRVSNTKSLMPVDGIVYVWYGDYTGTDVELLTVAMPIPSGKLLEHVQMYSGVITLITATGTVKMHEVV